MAWALIGIFWTVVVAAAAQPLPCTLCHSDRSGVDNAHPLLGAANGPACTDCHLGAAAHGADPRSADALADMVVFGQGSSAMRRDACRGCHDDRHAGPGADTHQQAGLACDSCHRVHGPEPLVQPVRPTLAGDPRADPTSLFCAGCHAGVFMEFASNQRHPLAEGAVGCTSCHDPHAAAPPSLLGHAGQQTCNACHSDKAGPFVFEHGTLLVDGCQSCHVPHGSPNRFLLTHQREGELCYSCHVTVPGFHVGFVPGAPPRFDEGTVCTNCHTAIHGSNLDRELLR